MSTFKMYNCDFGVEVDGVNYEYQDVDGLQIEDPENTRLVRGSNGSSKSGLIYKEGIKEPKRLSVTLIGMQADLYPVLKSAFDEKKRVKCWAVDRTDGSSVIGKQAIMVQQPQQLAIDDTPESMNVVLIFETFDLTYTHKS